MLNRPRFSPLTVGRYLAVVAIVEQVPVPTLFSVDVGLQVAPADGRFGAARDSMTATYGALRFLEHCTGNTMLYVLLPAPAARDPLLERLKAEGIHAVFHYVPLHASPIGRKLGCAAAPLPVTDDLSARIVRLPMYYEMTEEEQERVAGALMACCPAAPPSCESEHAVHAAPG